MALALEEYKTLRQEVVNTVDRQYSLANWGISSVAVVLAALLAAWEPLQKAPYLLTFATLVAIPVVATSYVLAWSHVISKISELGKRLYEIEENIARMVSTDEIREAYRLDADATVNPYRFLLGWEHQLWRGPTNIRVVTTVRVVKGLLAAMYLGAIAAGLSVALLLQHSTIKSAVTTASAALLVWAVLWFSLARYLKAVGQNSP
jgi:hypothetical protein